MGEIVSQMEAGDMPDLGNISRSTFECALRAPIKHSSMIEAIKLLRQYVGPDENGNLRLGLREGQVHATLQMEPCADNSQILTKL